MIIQIVRLSSSALPLASCAVVVVVAWAFSSMPLPGTSRLWIVVKVISPTGSAATSTTSASSTSSSTGSSTTGGGSSSSSSTGGGGAVVSGAVDGGGAVVGGRVVVVVDGAVVVVVVLVVVVVVVSPGGSCGSPHRATAGEAVQSAHSTAATTAAASGRRRLAGHAGPASDRLRSSIEFTWSAPSRRHGTYGADSDCRAARRPARAQRGWAGQLSVVRPPTRRRTIAAPSRGHRPSRAAASRRSPVWLPPRAPRSASTSPMAVCRASTSASESPPAGRAGSSPAR